MFVDACVPLFLAISRCRFGKQNGRHASTFARGLGSALAFSLSRFSHSFHPLIKRNKVRIDWNFRTIGKTQSFFFLLMRHFHFEVDLCPFNWKMKVNWVFLKVDFVAQTVL